MELLLHSVKLDWPVLLPIFICSLLTLAVAIRKFYFYNTNKRNISEFIPRLQKELSGGNLEHARTCAIQLVGIIG